VSTIEAVTDRPRRLIGRSLAVPPLQHDDVVVVGHRLVVVVDVGGRRARGARRSDVIDGDVTSDRRQASRRRLALQRTQITP